MDEQCERQLGSQSNGAFDARATGGNLPLLRRHQWKWQLELERVPQRQFGKADTGRGEGRWAR